MEVGLKLLGNKCSCFLGIYKATKNKNIEPKDYKQNCPKLITQIKSTAL